MADFRTAWGDFAQRALRTRWFARAPLALFRARAGWILGERFLMLEHIGRKSGSARHAVLEVIDRPRPGVYRVVSGLGRRSQWLRNVVEHPQVRLSVGRRRLAPARAEVLDVAATRAALARYAEQHPAAWRALEPVLRGVVADGEDVAAAAPVVEFTLSR